MNLKPCPFCGGEAVREPFDLFSARYFFAFCQTCNARVEAATEKGAVEKWNTRADEWIPADRCVPSDERWVQAKNKEGTICKVRYLVDVWWASGCIAHGLITHWMELPPLPSVPKPFSA